MDIESLIRTVPDFPKKGVTFKDITPLLKDPMGFKYVIDLLAERYKDKSIDTIAAVESRGFIIAGALAYQLHKGFVPLRKSGKLPYKVSSIEYTLEYGKDKLEIHSDAINQNSNVLLVDDLLATGGTCAAAVKLIEDLGGNIFECAFVIELADLKGREKLNNYNVYSILSFNGI